MKTHVWHVSTVGGDADQVKAAISRGLARLRAGDASDLSADEVEPWMKDVSHCSIEVLATEEGVSALVDITTFGEDSQLAAVLSGGFDEVVLDEVMTIDSVTEARHSDRIERP